MTAVHEMPPCDRLDGCPALERVTGLLERQQAAREAYEAFRATTLAERDTLRRVLREARVQAVLGWLAFGVTLAVVGLRSCAGVP